MNLNKSSSFLLSVLMLLSAMPVKASGDGEIPPLNFASSEKREECSDSSGESLVQDCISVLSEIEKNKENLENMRRIYNDLVHMKIRMASFRMANVPSGEGIEERYVMSITHVCSIYLNVIKFSTHEMSQEEIDEIFNKIDEESTELSTCLRYHGMLDRVFVDHTEKMVSDAKERLEFIKSAKLAK